MPLTQSVIERFTNKYQPEPNSGCWIWLAGTRDNRGAFWFNNKTIQAHRFSYEYFIGPIPKDLTIDHLCNTSICVNPYHLKPTTMIDNILRSEHCKPKLICTKGHPIQDIGIPNRRCKTCAANRSKITWHKNKHKCNFTTCTLKRIRN